ncbi:MAG: ParB/RepB/Spo0J family partition protein [Bacteroidota bacterium]
MGTRIAEVGKNLALYKVHVDEIKEQDINARVMPPEAFERLTENIRKEGRLEQLPFAVARGNFFELISGHHRLRAGRQAGLTEVFVLADERNLPRSKVVAKQLAHNAIAGEDDPQMLKRLYEEIESVDDILESYISPDDFDDVTRLESMPVTDISLMLEWKQLAMVFLPSTMERLDKIEVWAKKIPKDTDLVGVVSNQVFERFREAALSIGRAEDVRSLGAILTRMVDICEEWIAKNVPPDDAKPGPGSGPEA